LKKSWDGFKAQIQQKKVAISLDINEQVSLVSYPAMVKIIIENIIENAIHFGWFRMPLCRRQGFCK